MSSLNYEADLLFKFKRTRMEKTKNLKQIMSGMLLCPSKVDCSLKKLKN